MQFDRYTCGARALAPLPLRTPKLTHTHPEMGSKSAPAHVPIHMYIHIHSCT